MKQGSELFKVIIFLEPVEDCFKKFFAQGNEFRRRRIKK
jgi:hypothetical protein